MGIGHVLIPTLGINYNPLASFWKR